MIVCVVVAALALVASFAVISTVRALRKQVVSLERQIAKLDSSLAKQEIRVREMSAALAAKPADPGTSLLPIVGLLANAKRQGAVPTAILVSLRLLAAYLRRKGTRRLPTRPQ